MRPLSRFFAALIGFGSGLTILPVLARSPFDVGLSEGGGAASGVFGWIMAQQIAFERGLNAAVHDVATQPTAVAILAGLSFAYGVFHAAGPGHGKAVVASYMLANERALQRGLVLSLLAALLQGVVAIVLVGVMALVLKATAARMQNAAHGVELASFAAIAALGLWLMWRKGRALAVAWSDRQAAGVVAGAGHDGHVHHSHSHDHAQHDHSHHDDHQHGSDGHDHQDHDHDHDHGHVHDDHCGHYHAPDPSQLGEGFSWRAALGTVVAAGSRPCSGAILVLVYCLSLGIFWAGVVATLAMSLGTALTTGALASVAVLFKSLALRLSGAGGRGAGLLVRLLEFVAACLVFVTGTGLFFGLAAYGL